MQRLIGVSRHRKADPSRAETDRAELRGLGCADDFIFIDDDTVEDRLAGPGVTQALTAVQAGDRLVVLMFRPGALQSYEVLALAERLERIGASILIPKLNIDTGTARGMSTLRDLVEEARKVREYRAQRIREGVALAHAKGEYKGRVPTARRKAAAVRAFWESGRSAVWIAEKLQISRASVYRIVKEAGG